MGVGRGHEFENFRKKTVFLVLVVKTQFHHFWPPIPRKTWKNPLVAPSEKDFSDAHKHVKLHHFCKKLCCITPPGNTVEQHQCGKQAVAV